MSSISRGLHLAFAVVLLSAPMLADNGTILHFKNGSQTSTKTVSVGDEITFSSEGLLINNQLAASFQNVIEFSAERGPISAQQGSGLVPVGTTDITITMPETQFAEVVLVGPGEDTQQDPDPQPYTPDPPVTRDLSGATITVTGSYVYTGSPITPTFTVTYEGQVLKEGTDYVYELFDNTEVGRAIINITKGSGTTYVGSRMQAFDIVPCDLSDAILTLDKTEFDFTGKAIEPVVTVVLDDKTLAKDVDYELTYSNNVNPGTASLTVTGKDNYTGSVDTTFVIEAPVVIMVIDGDTINANLSTDGTVARYVSKHGWAWISGYNVATGENATLQILPDEGYVIDDVKMTGVADYTEEDVTSNSKRFTYAKPAGVLTVAIVFGEDPGTGIIDTAVDGLRFTVVDASTVRVTGAEETAKVSVYDARGQQMDADVQRLDNILIVRLAQQPQGLYIIKVNNNTFKIYKK